VRTEYPLVTGPLGPARRPSASKADLLARVRNVVGGLRMLTARSREMGVDVDDIEAEISRMEHMTALAIDEFMANRYVARNAELGYLRSRERRGIDNVQPTDIGPVQTFDRGW
jgi:hypothetical protein